MSTRLLTPFTAVFLIYLASSFIHGPIDPEVLIEVPHWRVGRVAFAPPLVLSGDSPHYLVAVNSLIEDGDFDLANNYRQARSGDWDMGARFRNLKMDRHVDRDQLGRELSVHSPFFSLLLAAFAWPWRNSFWVEPVSIWLTMLVALAGLALFAKKKPQGKQILVLALATPLWCYSRDLWTEPWLMTIWVVLLFTQNLAVLAIAGFLGTLIKCPFALAPMAMGVVMFWKRQYLRGGVLFASGILGLLTAFFFAQYLFQDVDHFSLFHLGTHTFSTNSGGIGASLVGLFQVQYEGVVGLLLGPENGLLWFFPFLAWGVWQFRKGGLFYFPALVFYLFHASYTIWDAGTGFSARFLVPMLPVMVLATLPCERKGRLFKVALAYSLFWALLGGLFPALVYDRTPWGVFSHLLSHF